ncbi:hypothetical protein [Rhizobium ruizarguesonis]|uniref:hypothetical protein n=1 Tax=Rhizobium ruizarguesonis TaxID=2081791 RepID=UPI00102F9E4A|nr:hypothetical protein [Rhizobium ruizarguesonis]TAZ23398.1 hypothetical protein ELH74_37690 [Rhizobium ruizarguesonis]TBD07704.1 hypothetical protein ELH23_38970 [Rhizobium ruizarguesonis]
MCDTMMAERSLMVAALLSVASSCASPQFKEEASNIPVVPVKAVIDSLKCGLSRALTLDKGKRSGIQGSEAKVKLNANVVVGRTVEGTISVGIPVSQGAGTLTPSLSGSSASTVTTNTTTEFQISLKESSSWACRAGGNQFQDGGFSTWFTAMVSDINGAVAGPPYASMLRYEYDTDFVIKKTVDGGASLEIVPIKVSGSVDASRSDIQHINVTIAAVSDNGRRKRGPDFMQEFQ